MARLELRSSKCEWEQPCDKPATHELHDGYEAPAIYCELHGHVMLHRINAAEARRRETRKAEALERYEREIAAIEKEGDS